MFQLNKFKLYTMFIFQMSGLPTFETSAPIKLDTWFYFFESLEMRDNYFFKEK